MLQSPESITVLSEILQTHAEMGNMIFHSRYRSWLAEAYLVAGQTGDGLEELLKAFAQAERSGERYWDAELHRLRGELLLLPGGSEIEAEESFHEALELARNQSAKSWELRAAKSLSQLWQKQGKSREAQELLAGIYGWFTEGFDTPDLLDAKALLGELSE